ncbi:MAG TPA: Gfo/Idh/MocA family oxidoreductase [Chthoniobacterales bacterium]
MLNIAIAGAGALGKRWAEVVARSGTDEARLRAIVDPLIGTNLEPAWLQEQTGLFRVTSIEQLGDVDIDAVLVTASSPAHATAIHQALRKGYHVLVEKPFTTNLTDAESLVDLAREKDHLLMVNQNYRFFPGPQTVKRLVTSGEFGSIRAVAGQFWCDWPGKPYQHVMLHPMSLEMAIHHFDLVRFMLGAEAVSGFVHEWNPRRSPYQMGGALEALFTLDSNGTSFPFSYTGSLVTTASAVPWAGFWRFEFDEASLFADGFGAEYALYLSSANGRVKISEFGDPAMGFDQSFTHFLDCIRNAAEPISSGRDNLNTLRMALSFLR